MMTFMLIIALAWICYRSRSRCWLASSSARAKRTRRAPKYGASRRPEKFVLERATA